MRSIQEIDAVESRYRGRHGEPSLGEAYRLLCERWRSGGRDTETGLRLMFLAWYTNCEPTHNTGLPNDDPTWPVFKEVFDSLGGESSNDPEFLLVVGFLAELFPWACGEDTEFWQRIGKEFLSRAHSTKPAGFRPQQFDGRGAFGDYIAHMLRSRSFVDS